MSIELVQKNRPLMDYTTFSPESWTTVEIEDRYAGSWQWGGGPYYDWCDTNCIDKYNIVKYSHRTIHARFKSQQDAMMFKLKWS